MAVRVDDGRNLQPACPHELKIRMKMPQGIDDHSFSSAHDHVAEASASWAADLKNSEVVSVDDCLGIVVIAPGLHAPLKSVGLISEAKQSLRHELRSTPFGA